MEFLKKSTLRLTSKYFEHSKSIYYRDWNENLMKAMCGHRPTCDNGIISFYFSVKRCDYQILFSKYNGKYLGSKQHFKNTKTEIGEYTSVS